MDITSSIVIALSLTTGIDLELPIDKIDDWGGLIMELKLLIPYEPRLEIEIVPPWYSSGFNFFSLARKTSSFVSAVENRQGFKIACLEEISLNKKWITKKNINEAIKFYGNCEYSKYLKKLIS